MTTIASKLQAAGWATHQIGKWHLGQVHNGSIPASRGFTTSFGYLGGAEDHYTNVNGGCGSCGSKPDLWRTTRPALGENGTEFMAYRYNREAVETIAAHARGRAEAAARGAEQQKLFMYLALQCAHAPNEPDAFAGLYSAAEYTEAYINYNGMISAVDSVVGNVTDALKAARLWAKALVIFTSDNGGPAAASVSGSSANNWPLRGGKHTAWDGGHRVLAFVTGGAVPKAMRGQKLEGYIHGADWYATIAGLAGVDPADDASGMPGIDSMDMWPYISGAVTASPRTELLLATAYSDHAKGWHGPTNGSAALIVGQYKLVRFAQQYCFWQGLVYPNASTNHSSPVEAPCSCGAEGCLFDIQADPGGRVDLAAKLTDVAARLRARAEVLDRGAIEAVKPAGWRGHSNGTLACDDAELKYGGFWGPDLFP